MFICVHLWLIRLCRWWNDDRHLAGDEQRADDILRERPHHRADVIAEVSEADPQRVIGKADELGVLQRIGAAWHDETDSAGGLGVDAVDRPEIPRPQTENRIERAGERIRFSVDMMQRGLEIVLRRQRRGEHDQRVDVHVIGQFFQRPDGDARAAAVTGQNNSPLRVSAVNPRDAIGDKFRFVMIVIQRGQRGEAGVIFGPVVNFDGGVEAAELDAGGQEIIDLPVPADAREM